jgi:protocatechuate 4,5-dioxygenase alpha chain
MTQDIHGYLAGVEDIPGTRVFTASRARAGITSTGSA